MNKYLITIIDQQGVVHSEIVAAYGFPSVSATTHCVNGVCGVPVKVELVLRAINENVIDKTEDAA